MRPHAFPLKSPIHTPGRPLAPVAGDGSPLFFGLLILGTFPSNHPDGSHALALPIVPRI